MSGATVWSAFSLLQSLRLGNRDNGLVTGQIASPVLPLRNDSGQRRLKCISNSGEVEQEKPDAGSSSPEDVLCFCGMPAVVKVCSKRAKHPGFRFLACPHGKPWFARKLSKAEQEKNLQRCDFFSWIDVPPPKKKEPKTEGDQAEEKPKKTRASKSSAATTGEGKPKRKRKGKSVDKNVDAEETPVASAAVGSENSDSKTIEGNSIDHLIAEQDA